MKYKSLQFCVLLTGKVRPTKARSAHMSQGSGDWVYFVTP